MAIKFNVPCQGITPNFFSEVLLWTTCSSVSKETFNLKKNQKARLLFASEHVVWTDDEWSRDHFSDESKYNVIGSKWKRFVWLRISERQSFELVKKTAKFGGGSVMVWGMLLAGGCGLLVRLQGCQCRNLRRNSSTVCHSTTPIFTFPASDIHDWQRSLKHFGES